MKKTPGRHAQAREAAKQETREALIKAATELFAEKGIDVSLDDICANAGYTRGAFYVHFKNRDEISAEVMRRVGAGVLDTLLGKGEDADFQSINGLATRFMQALVSGEYPLTKAGGVRPFQLLDACARSDDIRLQYLGHVSNGIDRLAEITRRLQANGEIRGDADAKQLAMWMVTLIIGLHTLYDLDAPLDLGSGMQTLLTLIKP